MIDVRYDRLDELLVRVRRAEERQTWRRRFIDAPGSETPLSILRALKAVKLAEVTKQGASVRDVADYMAVEHESGSRTITSAEAAGLVTKTVAAQDRRCRMLVLTDAGRRILDEATESRRAAVKEAVATWPDADFDTLLTLLERLAADFERGIST